MPDPWNEFRALMPVTQQWAYFDHAAVAPLAAPAQQAIVDFAHDLCRNGEANWKRWRQNVEEVRRLGAEMLGASNDEIAVIRNTTEGINIVAEGYPWKQGDNLVTLDCEFPSNLYPWMNLASRGVETRLLPVENERLDLNRLEEACDEKTRIVSVSWVGYATGWRNDVPAIAEIAHRHGALFFLDAIQGLGVFPLDVGRAGVDFLAADGHKWLLGPEGAGLFYIRREHLDVLRPLGVGWNSVVQAGSFGDVSFQLKPDASRYEGGSHNLCGIAGLQASLACLVDLGIEPISQRLLEVTDRLCERLEKIGAEIVSCRENERRSGIVSFELPGRDPKLVRQLCLDRNVVLSVRGGRIRVSPHAYTDQSDVNRLIQAIDRTA